jgi:hypothetical protein
VPFVRVDDARGQDETRPVALVNVTLIDGTGTAARSGMTLLVDGDTITTTDHGKYAMRRRPSTVLALMVILPGASPLAAQGHFIEGNLVVGHDDRVHPGHARKMRDTGHDVLFFEATTGGHGTPETINAFAADQALEFAFLLDRLGVAGRLQFSSNTSENSRPTANPDSAIVFGVADEFFAEYAARAANLDYPGALHDRLPDNSMAGLRRWQEREDEWLNRLDAVDADVLWGSAAWALYVSLRERLEASVQFRVCRRPLWNVDPDWGWHIDFKLPDLARSQRSARRRRARRRSGDGADSGDSSIRRSPTCARGCARDTSRPAHSWRR